MGKCEPSSRVYILLLYLMLFSISNDFLVFKDIPEVLQNSLIILQVKLNLFLLLLIIRRSSAYANDFIEKLLLLLNL